MRTYRTTLIGVLLGAIVFGISVSVLVDIAIESLTIHWPGPVTMAMPTAICFVCTGIGLVLLSVRK